jgi:hypothetical protein
MPRFLNEFAIKGLGLSLFNCHVWYIKRKKSLWCLCFYLWPCVFANKMLPKKNELKKSPNMDVKLKHKTLMYNTILLCFKLWEMIPKNMMLLKWLVVQRIFWDYLIGQNTNFDIFLMVKHVPYSTLNVIIFFQISHEWLNVFGELRLC